ncbi:tRNA isopentenyl-2-thiomethyl-A-37 hydroxylase MiaE [Oceanimonas baumannii]|uniref:tRNA-(Ms[2]io[6]A)-hydroxylase n=1 Tax=Oceanimonas baumannii TaxID=129578 RepID=A0A235CPX1_9GAMM|nr:tRNA isopentenyl-2-thiomethyl-A-37 hydroxylase MiaE [Oceanimonas baumannii]OYD26047.1 tRNA-(ms[2]io[6]A)-hydroxylase [Oceanimonas baumannii]TDW62311.1 tRNA-(ms[2]io[6]A)-hydroxylase [Oceanimonas baumannii]
MNASLLNAEFSQLLAPIDDFLHCATPPQWLEEARKPERLAVLLVDHANCEMKAAMSAHSLVRRYCLPKEKRKLLPNLDFYKSLDALPEKGEVLGKQALMGNNRRVFDELSKNDLLVKMVRLIQEELHHFEQVLEIMSARKVAYDTLSASRYAKGMLAHVRTHEPAAIVDRLIIGAYIEARSCERFAQLAPYLDEELSRFYVSLLRSEARHYQDYLTLAQDYAGESIDERVAFFGEQEAALIQAPDPLFRFHSGVPSVA